MLSSARVLHFYITALAWLAASLSVVVALLARPADAESVVEAGRFRAMNGPNVSTSTPTPDCDLAWRRFPNPNVAAGPSYLSGISAVSRDDAWAVGATLSGTTTLAMHWDGTQWSIFPSPAPGSNISVGGVTAISPDDAWAVGYYNNSRQLLTMHWNGTAWSAVPNPNPGGNYVTYLHDVDSTASNDVWAVGFYREYAPKGLVMHWDGASWGVVSSPMNPGINFLSAVDAVAPNDVWAVGFYGPGASIPYQAFAMHWNGSGWTVLATPTLGGLHNYFSSVVALAPNDVWAVGYTYDGTTTSALAEHWDGSTWSVVATPLGLASLADVDAAAPDDVWAVGEGATVIHWDGVSWNLVEIPGLMPGLGDIDVRTADDIWAAGSTGSPSQPQTWRYSRVCVPETSTPTPTALSTATVVATPTQCDLAFTDVPSDSTFYTVIRCLACRGIISSYDDGTFRPYNDVTRGQIAKIVSNAAGINEDPGPQIYEDVPESSTFYQWINRLANREYMGGYPCDIAPGEPCVEPGNLAYFRPNSSATRGQMAKIVSNAAGLGGTPTGVVYTDVQEDNPFYLWIMRLTEQGVMSGYDCGGEGEPCDSENRPYFRPYNTVTRGQASKIVANSFFPGCQPPTRP